MTYQLYYGLKPWLPWAVRMAVRRFFARRDRARHQARWPIAPGSQTPPAGWPGWPEGRQFALVLTHDVESPAGLEQSRALMELEIKLGFRSAFNLIPEGPYPVTPELRQQWQASGFEVGVHDLKHDGKLYRSRQAFVRNARRINQYLTAWKAVGFRSGFMHHQLDWLHELDILYDSSTFDTDPFEPQPDGVHTIFPFWVPKPEGWTGEKRPSGPRPQESAGYVELPYTLPQDSTLFLLFREPDIAIWRTKLDWIAAHGGMALVNVHPDYLSFDGAGRSPRQFPVAHYRALLEYVRERYAGRFWHALPSEVAHYVRRVLRPATPAAQPTEP